jgi:uncharacterized protein (UPF0333 family)
MIVASLVFLIGYLALLSHFFMGLAISSPAINKSKDAILEYPKAKEYKANGEKELYLRLKNDWGITKDHITVVTIAYGVSRGELNTKYFKNLRYRQDNFEVKPEVKYMIYDKSGQGLLSCGWSW